MYFSQIHLLSYKLGLEIRSIMYVYTKKQGQVTRYSNLFYIRAPFFKNRAEEEGEGVRSVITVNISNSSVIRVRVRNQ